MDMLIDSAAGHAIFSFMDGFSGYNQIRMSPKDAAKAAFRTLGISTILSKSHDLPKRHDCDLS